MIKSTFEFRDKTFFLIHDELTGTEVQTDAVLGIGGATQTLLNLIPNHKFKKSWDLGCGSGAITLALARTCERVIATDISKRAIDFAMLSADENQLHNIDFRVGSMFEPVQDETFDFIISNPPFVIGNVTNLEHRESPFLADGLTRELLEKTPHYLTDQGLAIFLTAWLETEDETWEDRIEQMLPKQVNVWVGLRDLLPVAQYVDVWLADAKITDPDLRNQWIAKLMELKTTSVAFGIVAIQNDMSVEPCQTINDVRNANRLPNGEELIATINDMKTANSLNANQILSAGFQASTGQSWRGDFTLDGVLSGLRTNLSSGLGFEEACQQVAAELDLETEDVRIYGLVGVKTLVSMGLLSLNTPRI